MHSRAEATTLAESPCPFFPSLTSSVPLSTLLSSYLTKFGAASRAQSPPKAAGNGAHVARQTEQEFSVAPETTPQGPSTGQAVQEAENFIETYQVIGEWIRFADTKAAATLTVNGVLLG